MANFPAPRLLDLLAQDPNKIPCSCATGCTVSCLKKREKLNGVRLATKTGEADDTVPINSSRMMWIEPVLKIFAARPAGDSAFNLDYSTFYTIVHRASLKLGVTVAPYQGRHSGAPLDFAQSTRSSSEIQRHGRW